MGRSAGCGSWSARTSGCRREPPRRSRLRRPCRRRRGPRLARRASISRPASRSRRRQAPSSRSGNGASCWRVAHALLGQKVHLLRLLAVELEAGRRAGLDGAGVKSEAEHEAERRDAPVDRALLATLGPDVGGERPHHGLVEPADRDVAEQGLHPVAAVAFVDLAVFGPCVVVAHQRSAHSATVILPRDGVEPVVSDRVGLDRRAEPAGVDLALEGLGALAVGGGRGRGPGTYPPASSGCSPRAESSPQARPAMLRNCCGSVVQAPGPSRAYPR